MSKHRKATYINIDDKQHPCEVIDEAVTQVKVQFTEQVAAELKLELEPWLPKTHVKFDE